MKPHRSSSVASVTMRTSGFLGSRVHAQKEVALLVSVTPGSPCALLNHCRSVSTKDTIAMGTRKMLHSCTDTHATCSVTCTFIYIGTGGPNMCTSCATKAANSHFAQCMSHPNYSCMLVQVKLLGVWALRLQERVLMFSSSWELNLSSSGPAEEMYAPIW